MTDIITTVHNAYDEPDEQDAGRLYPGLCPRCGAELAACSPSGRGTAACDRCETVYGDDE